MKDHRQAERVAEFDRVVAFLAKAGVNASQTDREVGREGAISWRGNTIATLREWYSKGTT